MNTILSIADYTAKSLIEIVDYHFSYTFEEEEEKEIIICPDFYLASLPKPEIANGLCYTLTPSQILFQLNEIHGNDR